MSLKKLGRYELIRILGNGAMGLVYKGRDPSLDRQVAIKTISMDQLSVAAAADYELRFRNEARSAGRLQHANIVSVYDAGRDGDIAFLVMELIDGKDLKHFLDNGERYSLAQSLAIMEDLLAALGCAHSQNVIHRDVKPANLLVEKGGRIKLTDFGVARIQDAGDATRKESTMVGTLKYMSPEQVKGLVIDARADIFAAGVVLYQLLTGHRPFTGTTDFEIIQQIVGQHPLPVTARNPSLPAGIDRVVSKAMAKACDQRFQTVGEFLSALLASCQDAADLTATPMPGSSVAAGSWSETLQNGEALVGIDTNTNTNIPGRSAGTITQELELVYWKDVRQSSEPRDLQLFIEKFPAGIYIDLALRRLQTIEAAGQAGFSASVGPSWSGEATGSGFLESGTQGLAAISALHDDRPGSASPTGGSAAGATVAQQPAAPEQAPFSDTTDPSFSFSVTNPTAGDIAFAASPTIRGTAALLARAGSGTRPVSIESRSTQAKLTTRRTKGIVTNQKASGPLPWLAKRRQVWLTGLVAMGVAGAVFGVQRLLLPGAGVVDAVVATSAPPGLSTLSPSPPAQGPAIPEQHPAPTVESGASSRSLGAPKAAPVAAASERAAARVTAAGKIRAVAPPPPAEPPAGPAEPMPGPLAPATRVPVAAARVLEAASPRAACESRVLLGFQFCMAEQCQKPVFAGHAVCQERIAMEERRREAEQLRR